MENRGSGLGSRGSGIENLEWRFGNRESGLETRDLNYRKGMEMAGSGHENYAAWQVAMDLAAEIYRLVKLLPKEEKYTLGDQLKRAAISVPSNIAEGQARGTTREFVRFLYIARGSVCAHGCLPEIRHRAVSSGFYG